MRGALLGYTKNGAPVYDRPKSHIHTEYSDVFSYLRAVLPLTEPNDRYYEYTHTFDEVIGESICVPTDESDEIIYAQRVGRDGYTRFVKNREPLPATSFTVVLKLDQRSVQEQYILMTAYVGDQAPAEPWAKTVPANSLEFWSSHALIWGSMPVIEGTETNECPW